LSRGANGSGTIVNALPGGAILTCGAIHANASGFGTLFCGGIARQSCGTRQARAIRNACARFADLIHGALHAQTWIDTLTDATNLPVGTNHVRTRSFALSHDTNFAHRTRNFFACRVDAKTSAGTNEVGWTNEFV
jgi:hypothetical protein